jgi:hypothetical protein
MRLILDMYIYEYTSTQQDIPLTILGQSVNSELQDWTGFLLLPSEF